MTILQAKNLIKKFNDTKVLNGINLSINEGEFVAIMGQSGSGKSTLLYNISGMDKATSGEIKFNNTMINQLSDDEMSHLRLSEMGFIFQNSHLLKNLSIYDNIVLPGYKRNTERRVAINEKAESLMKRMGIDHIASHDINKVSGGQLQRAAICRALINQPKMIFGDEPTGALNSSVANDIMDIINELNQEGTTIMLVTHDANVAARSDRIIFLVDGIITSELVLGKYQESDYQERRQRLNEWLIEQGF